MKAIHIVLVCIFFSFSCKQKQATVKETGSTQDIEHAVRLNPEQIALAGIVSGRISKQLISETVECSGEITAPPNSQASVSVPVGGYVKKVARYTGSFVRKGDLLITLEHPNYIRLQQEFLEAQSEFELYRQEYKRQGELAIEEAASMKKAQKAEADFKTAEARYLSLQAQLAYLGIEADSISQKGMNSTIKLYAPISGYVTAINTNLGDFAGADKVLIEIVNEQGLFLHLELFERDIHRIHAGQQISFSTLYQENQTCTAQVKTIGKKVNNTSRTIDIHGQIKNTCQGMIPGMYVKAQIHMHSDSVYALPTTAVVSEDNRSFVFLDTDKGFIKQEIQVGHQQGELIEVSEVTEDLLSATFVLDGAYYIQAEMEVDEE